MTSEEARKIMDDIREKARKLNPEIKIEKEKCPVCGSNLILEGCAHCRCGWGKCN